MGFQFIECPQGSEAWLQSRAGKITASCFAAALSTVGGLTDQQAMYVKYVLDHRKPEAEAAILAGYKKPPTSETVAAALRGDVTEKPSETAHRYAADIAMERISGFPYGEPPKSWILQRGHEMEKLARMHYESRTGAFVTEAGLCVLDDSPLAYSSDGLIDDDGLMECKAPVDPLKILHILKTGDVSEHMMQMQGGMGITGRKYCDFLMYVPALANAGNDLYVKRIHRDDDYIHDMMAKLARFDLLVQQYEKDFRQSVI